MPAPESGCAGGAHRFPRAPAALRALLPPDGCGGPAGPRARPLAGTLWVEDGRHCTLDVPFQENNGRMRKGNAPAVMGILHRAALNRLRTMQRHLESSIGLLHDRVGRQPWILASVLP